MVPAFICQIHNLIYGPIKAYFQVDLFDNEQVRANINIKRSQKNIYVMLVTHVM